MELELPKDELILNCIYKSKFIQFLVDRNNYWVGSADFDKLIGEFRLSFPKSESNHYNNFVDNWLYKDNKINPEMKIEISKYFEIITIQGKEYVCFEMKGE